VSVTTASSGPRQQRIAPQVPVKTKRSRWLVGVFGLVLVGGIGVGTVLVRHWPYSEAQVVPGLQDTFKTTVTVGQYRRFYFPHPGCELEIVRLERPTKVGREKPLATAQKIRITGRYTDLLFRPYHLASIEVNGLRVRIPAPGEPKNWNEGTDENDTSSRVSVGRVVTDGAVLEIEREKGELPLKFEIHKLLLTSIAPHEPMDYEVSIAIPDPPGELESKGKLGPWEGGETGKTPLSGSVKLGGATLNKYSGLGGTIQSEERFGGTLEQVEVTGEANATDFELVSAGHKVELLTQFDVTVNAVKGEAQLKGIVGRVGQTTIHVQGEVVENAKSDHREASLDFSTANARAEDLLWVFSKASKPAMIGPAVCSGHVRMRKFGDGFLDALEANGKFEVKNGRFQKTVQVKTNVLSARAQGNKIKAADDAPEVAVENLSSEVKIRNGVANLTSTYFQVPGARARVEGTYKLGNAQVDLHGNLWTDASLSDNTTGIKTMLLEPLDPLFRRKHAGSMIGVSMEGDIHQPRIGAVLTKKKAPWGKQQQNSKIEITK
jgi:AsmA-like C-terminal region